jgi:hypothetical protein
MIPIDSLLSRLRERDLEELREVGLSVGDVSLMLALPAVEFRMWSGLHGPAAFIAFHQLTPKALQVSMLASDEWPLVARDMYRWGVTHCRPRLLELGYTRAECRVMSGHDDAIRMLEHLGFVKECDLPDYGASGRMFHQFAWRLNDHVPLQNAESPATATAVRRVSENSLGSPKHACARA